MWSAWLDNITVCFPQYNHYWVETAVNNTSQQRQMAVRHDSLSRQLQYTRHPKLQLTRRNEAKLNNTVFYLK
jgi:hypothetical protein